jgi:nucleoid DNA-binding protein
MTKLQMAKRIAKATGLPTSHVRQVINHFLVEVGVRLEQEGRLELRDFGVFTVVEHPAYMGRNPRTGQPAAVEAMSKVRFKAGKALSDRLNEDNQ